MERAIGGVASEAPETRQRAVKALCRIPNVGPAVAEDLLRLGIGRLEELRGRDPEELYQRLCRIDGTRHDPCMRDVFAAITDYAGGAPARPWWEYSRIRKARERDNGEGSPR